MSDSMKLTVLVQFVSTWTMIGVIWFVQVVHYPLFACVGGSTYRQYMAAHVRRTGWVVGPPMLLEAAAALRLLGQALPGAERLAAWSGVLLLGGIWASTWLLQVPRHHQLAAGFDPRAHAALVSTNWIRTFSWSLRGLLALWWLT